MSLVLGIIAIAVLLVIFVFHVRLRHEARAAVRHQAAARTSAGEAQHQDSLRRRAEVRATPAEDTGTIASRTDE